MASVVVGSGLGMLLGRLRLLRVRDVPVADLLSALVVAPLLTQLVVAVR